MIRKRCDVQLVIDRTDGDDRIERSRIIDRARGVSCGGNDDDACTFRAVDRAARIAQLRGHPERHVDDVDVLRDAPVDRTHEVRGVERVVGLVDLQRVNLRLGRDLRDDAGDERAVAVSGALIVRDVVIAHEVVAAAIHRQRGMAGDDAGVDDGDLRACAARHVPERGRANDSNAVLRLRGADARRGEEDCERNRSFHRSCAKRASLRSGARSGSSARRR